MCDDGLAAVRNQNTFVLYINIVIILIIIHYKATVLPSFLSHLSSSNMSNNQLGASPVPSEPSSKLLFASEALSSYSPQPLQSSTPSQQSAVGEGEKTSSLDSRSHFLSETSLNSLRIGVKKLCDWYDPQPRKLEDLRAMQDAFECCYFSMSAST